MKAPQITYFVLFDIIDNSKFNKPMKKLIIVGVIIFLFLIGNTVIAQTCKHKGKLPYETAERQLRLVTNQNNALNVANQIDSQVVPQQLNLNSNQVEQRIDKFHNILHNYQQVPKCSAYYTEANLQIPKVRDYINQLNAIIDE